MIYNKWQIIFYSRGYCIQACSFHFQNPIPPIRLWNLEIMYRSRYVSKRFTIFYELFFFVVHIKPSVISLKIFTYNIHNFSIKNIKKEETIFDKNTHQTFRKNKLWQYQRYWKTNENQAHFDIAKLTSNSNRTNFVFLFHQFMKLEIKINHRFLY